MYPVKQGELPENGGGCNGSRAENEKKGVGRLIVSNKLILNGSVNNGKGFGSLRGKLAQADGIRIALKNVKKRL